MLLLYREYEKTINREVVVYENNNNNSMHSRKHNNIMITLSINNFIIYFYLYNTIPTPTDLPVESRQYRIRRLII